MPYRGAQQLPTSLGALNLTSVTPEHAAALEPLLTRRSTAALHPPAPSDDEIHAILTVATSVPDHGGLRPWRFVVISGDARAAFGEALAQAALEARPELDESPLERIRAKAFVAPVLIAVAARIDTSSKVPAWEQEASAACAGYAIALAAHQLGLGAIWKSAPVHEGVAIEKALDLAPDDRFLGWVNIGHVGPDREPAMRSIPDLADLVRTLDVDGTPVAYVG
jgi:nitroreductase